VHQLFNEGFIYFIRYRVICAPTLSDQNMHLLKNLFTAMLCCIIFQHELAAQTDSPRLKSQDTTARPAVRNTLQPVNNSTPGDSGNVIKRVFSPKQDSIRRAQVLIKARSDSAIKSTIDSANKSRQDSMARIVADSLKKLSDSLKLINDSIERIRLNVVIRSNIANVQSILSQHKFLKFSGHGQSRNLYERKAADKNFLFYFLCGIVLYFAIFKLFFSKYLGNLFTLFFRVTMRQQQIREQLLQTPLPSLLLNLLFIVSAGMYLNLVLFYLDKNPVPQFWLNFSYCVGFVSLLYLGKLLILKSMGWIFNVSNATNTYLFIVFLVNKMIGMFLLPFLFILAFPHPTIISGMVTLSFILVIALFFYRFIISYRPIRNEINVGRLHFIIYLCAFEIAPLLLIYKVLLIFVDRSN